MADADERRIDTLDDMLLGMVFIIMDKVRDAMERYSDRNLWRVALPLLHVVAVMHQARSLLPSEEASSRWSEQDQVRASSEAFWRTFEEEYPELAPQRERMYAFLMQERALGNLPNSPDGRAQFARAFIQSRQPARSRRHRRFSNNSS